MEAPADAHVGAPASAFAPNPDQAMAHLRDRFFVGFAAQPRAGGTRPTLTHQPFELISQSPCEDFRFGAMREREDLYQV